MDKKVIFMYLSISVVILFVVYSVMQKIGIIKTAAEKAKANKVQQLTESTADFYTSEFYKTFDKKYLLNEKEAKDIAATLHESMFSSGVKSFLTYGVASLGTDESKLFAALTKIKSKVKFSQIADVYNKAYSTDLYTDILSELGETDLLKFSNYIESLPTK